MTQLDASTTREEPDAGPGLSEAERRVSDAIGRLMVLWGFKRNMGRVWTVLFLSESPVPARELQRDRELSSGAVSMTLTELSKWGVVNKRWMSGDRRDYYVAEANLWKMISRVLSEREHREISAVLEAFEQAKWALERQPRHGAGDKARIAFQSERIDRLIVLAKLGRTMLDALIANAQADASWLPRFVLGRRRKG